ncbi:NYN domain-containing protein [Marivita hallyeonensis]|uniref:NYN domain-containing protein n=1 Tax=Marivita hallyeonensis TaxID=996342 RepID=A0A1M5XS12_9RHOB|nr:NYN domain-containing protein [Marivita hallyeonensis]SHI02570.1 NYN domain-containing protein [Marivita hallyeonensis]
MSKHDSVAPTNRCTALFIDGDNVDPSYAPGIFTHAGAAGRIDIARVYLRAQSTSPWSECAGVHPIFASTTRKNATDLMLSVDAMECALVRRIDTVVIAASDRDYTHLAVKLREHGVLVVGLGDHKAPRDLREAFHEFHDLSPTNKPCATHAATKQDARIQKIISGARDGLSVAELGAKMYDAHGVRSEALPGKNWRKYLQSRQNLYEVDISGPHPRVRCRTRTAIKPD